MFFAELLLALIIAMLLSVTLIALFGRSRPGGEGFWASFFFFFMILFLATWAGGTWLVPFGPVAWGFVWLPYLVVGLVIALLLAVLLPSAKGRRRSAEARAAASAGVMNGFFWALLLLLAVMVVTRYVA